MVYILDSLFLIAFLAAFYMYRYIENYLYVLK